MNKDFTFDALKGNAKVVDLEELIRIRKRQLREWVDPFYSADRKDWAVLGYEDNYFLYIEPEWPTGQKRLLKRQWQEYTSQISKLMRFQAELFRLAYPGWEDDFAKYSVQPIVINRKEYKNDPS